jgi:CheY-like chemotaxis protein
MNILIVEDNANKLRQIKELLKELYPQCGMEEAFSFKGGLKKIYENRWDFIILDMSLPTYDITHTESGGDKKPVAGKNIMKHMINRKIIIPVIVITQFESFDDDRISLESLNKEFEEKFQELWRGTIFYGDDDWRLELKYILESILM